MASAAVSAYAAQAAPELAPRADLATVAALVAQQTNALRTANGLAPLKVDPTLAEAARHFAEFMAGNDQYGHEADGRTASERAQAQGYEHCAIAENIGFQFSSLGFGTDELASRLVEGWEQSPGHRRNMLLPQVVDIGVGVAHSPRTQRYYAVQVFGRPGSAAVRFDIGNRSDAVIRYQLEGNDFTLAPRVTRSHQGCFGGSLKVQWPDGPPSPAFQPRDGARYTVLRDHTGQLRLRSN